MMELKKIIEGNVIQEGDENYHEVRKVWNGLIDNKPRVIVQCQNFMDVVHAVTFANQEKLRISVRGGGHSVAGNAIVNKGMVIDFNLMKGIKLDHIKQNVVAEAGLLGGELDLKTQEFGLAAPLGTVSHTGIAGLTLGGGYGWLSRKFALACDNLLSVDVVTANGEFLTIDSHHYSDLFWAIRGGSGNFAIVTAFRYNLHKVGPEIFGGQITYPLEKAYDVLKLYSEFTKTQSNDFTTYAYFFHDQGQLVCCLTFFSLSSFDQGMKAIEPFRKIAPPLRDTVGRMPYIELQKLMDQRAPHGLNYYWRSNYMNQNGLTSESIKVFLEKVKHISSEKSIVSIEQIGGKVNSISKDSTAFFHRNADYNCLICSAWEDKSSQEKHIKYADDFWKAMTPYFLPASYQNYGGELFTNPITFYGENYSKLSEIKQKYDPNNILVGSYAFD